MDSEDSRETIEDFVCGEDSNHFGLDVSVELLCLFRKGAVCV